MLFSFNPLAVRLQAVTRILKQSSHCRMTYWVSELFQFSGKLTRALARPFQRRLRIAARGRFHETFQSVQQPRISLVGCFATRANSSLPTRWRSISLTQFANAISYRAIRNSRRLGNRRNSTTSQRERFNRYPTTAGAFIEIIREVLVLRLNPSNDRIIRHALRMAEFISSRQHHFR